MSRVLPLLLCLFVWVPCVFVEAVLASNHALPVGSKSPSKLLISNVNLLAMTGKSPVVLQNYSVLIDQNKIVQIAPSAKVARVEGAIVVNGQGKFLLPGLMDVHVHLWDEAELSAYLAFGITTVRNASGMPFHLTFESEIESGRMEGPRLITTGPILNGQGPNTQINHQVVHNAKEARDAVQKQYQQGFRHLKVYSNLSTDAYSAILSEAKKLGMSIMGHTPEGVRDPGIPHSKPFHIAFNHVLSHGFVSIEHMESIVWHALYDELSEKKVKRLARDIAKSGTAVTPTLVAHHNLLLVAQSRGEYLKRPGVEFLNPYISMFEKESYQYWSSQPPETRKDFHEFYLRATKIFQDEGVVLLAGTDAGIFTNVPGVSLIEELELLVDAGLTPYQALQSATINSAKVLGLDGQAGKIELGYGADLILVDGDPTKDIASLRSLSGLVVRGKWYDEGELSRLKQQAAATAYQRTEQRVRLGLAAQGVVLD